MFIQNLSSTGFSKQVLEQLSEFIRQSKDRTERKVAVFDADGTLWKGDIGDRFLDYQLKNGQILASDVEDYYKAVSQGGHEAEIYSWPALWNAGRTVNEVELWSRECFESFKHQIFPAQRALVQELQNSGFEVWVVSASVWWVVVAGVAHFGIPASRVIATKVLVDEQNRLVRQLAHPVPYKGGKVAAIHREIGKAPCFVSGNSMGDYDMMNLAHGLVLAINSDQPGGLYFETEQTLRKNVELKQKEQNQSSSNVSQARWVLQQFS